MKERYFRNLGAINESEQKTLLAKKVLVLGLGGLGGFSCELIARIGVKELRICDFDCFCESNLNRQINCLVSSISKSKSEITKKRLNDINPNVNVKVFNQKFDSETAYEMIKGVDVIIDSLDNVESRLVLEKVAKELNVPIVFGAVSKWEGQVSTIMPNSTGMSKFYNIYNEDAKSVLPFVCSLISSYQVAETVKVLLNKPSLENKILLIDSEINEYKILDL